MGTGRGQFYIASAGDLLHKRLSEKNRAVNVDLSFFTAGPLDILISNKMTTFSQLDSEHTGTS